MICETEDLILTKLLSFLIFEKAIFNVALFSIHYSLNCVLFNGNGNKMQLACAELEM